MLENAFKGAFAAVLITMTIPFVLMILAAVFHPGKGDLSIGVLALALPLLLPVAAVIGWFIGKRWPGK
jgi:hypothetical protein